MKITLIHPPIPFGGHKVNMPIAPPALEYLAGLTTQLAPDVEIELIDAHREDVSLESLHSDLVGFTALTPQAPWAYRSSDWLRNRGIKTVLGGIHTSSLPEEAALHADTIVIGEAESVWSDLLADLAKNRLKKIYHGEKLALDNLPHPRTDLLKDSYTFRGFFTSRGCPYHCSFCSAAKLFGNTMRYRPVQEVVNEIASSKQRLLFNVDNTIWGPHINRSIELYKELSKNVGLKWWFGEADLITVHHEKAEELLKWARRSGLTAVIVGWESNNPKTLSEFKAIGKQGKDRKEAVKKIQDAGIAVEIFIVLGGLNDTLDDFQRVLAICDELKVSAHLALITPYPGTDLYEEYKDRILPDLDWDSFDSSRAVFSHSRGDMSIENREQALIILREELNTWPRIISRIGRISRKGFPMGHLISFIFQYQQRVVSSRIARDSAKRS